MLPQLEQNAIYNAINFSWGVDTAPSTANIINTTAIYTRVAAFLCPSDPNQNSQPSPNNYFASVGTTTNFTNGGNSSVASLADHPTTGFFGYQVCYGIRDAIDGTSNTIAFAESTIGSSTGVVGQNNIGVPAASIPSGALLYDASTNIPATQSGLAACDQAAQTQGTWVLSNRGILWAYGAMGETMFNTVALPNSVGKWTFCGNVSSTTLVVYSEADSMHSGGINTMMGDGSVRFIKNSINRMTWMASGPRATARSSTLAPSEMTSGTATRRSGYSHCQLAVAVLHAAGPYMNVVKTGCRSPARTAPHFASGASEIDRSSREPTGRGERARKRDMVSG